LKNIMAYADPDTVAIKFMYDLEVTCNED
jgi:hypothetical protein